MPGVPTRAEYLSFDAIVGPPAFPAIPMNSPAWDVLDYAALYDGPPLVGEDRAIPGATVPRIAIGREIDESVVALRLVIYGDRSYDDVPYADPRVGVRANVEFLRSNLLLPPGTADGSRPVTFHRLDGTTDVGSVVVAGPLDAVPAGPTSVRGVLRLAIPAGFLV